MNRLDPTHYVPIMRWRRAERSALARLTADDSTCLTPLVELVPESCRLGASGSTIEQVANRISCQLFRAWSERPLFIDLCHLPQKVLTQGSTHLLAMLGYRAAVMQVSLVPVLGLRRDIRYQSAVIEVLGRHGEGVCLRLSRDDVSRPTLAQDLSELLRFLNVTHEAVDLLVDFQIIDQPVSSFAALCARIPEIHKWRNFIVASGAFPPDLSDLEKNRQHTIERLDWISWRDQATAMPPVTRLPIYSDYTIQHPQYRERQGPQNYSASIRYTANDYWVVMRGEGVLNKDGPGTAQWPANALLLCERPEYCGEAFSDGDRYIREQSVQCERPGNAITWLQAGINHHMTFVVRQLATLSETSVVPVS